MISLDSTIIKDDKKLCMHWFYKTVWNAVSILYSFKAGLRTLGIKPE